ncbi:MAG: HesA/MoeB/ThiF family protein [Thermoguttaceae bacterium]|nr:HesA/MoeB/ThiF family protein [Thermoguttaceae bacterium]
MRQIRFSLFGEESQRRLRKSSAFVCGCGALGNFVAMLLVRAGVGKVRIADPDTVELVNLHRQILFDEADCQPPRLKVEAAAEKLRRANSEVSVEALPVRVTAENVEALCKDVDIIVDATDNFETRFLLNDVAIKRGIPWVFGGCLGAEGQVLAIVPGRTPCLQCLLGECPPSGMDFTCEMVGIFGPVAGVIASLEAMEAIKILSGNVERIVPRLTVVDLWYGDIRQVDLTGLRENTDCPVCKKGQFRFLSGEVFPSGN